MNKTIRPVTGIKPAGPPTSRASEHLQIIMSSVQILFHLSTNYSNLSVFFRDLQGNNLTVVFETDFEGMNSLRIL